MSVDVAAIVERARLAAQQPDLSARQRAEGRALSERTRVEGAPTADREQLKRIAAEFESMLLVQVLKDMRRAGSWEEEGSDTLGAQSLFETLDVELALQLAKVKGIGLGGQMEEAFERLNGTGSTPNLQLPTSKAGELGVGNWQVEAAAAKTGKTAVATATAVQAHRPPGREVITAFVADEPGPDVVTVVKAAVEKTAAAVEKAGPALGHILKPVAGAVTSAFGWRRHPITHEVKFHQGVDLRAAYGQEVQSAAAGKVVFSGDQGGYGATVVVEHEDGTRTRYAHLSARLVAKGDEVTAGEPLGRAGKSGRATGTHLHFEVIAPNGQRIAPERWAGGRNAPVAAGQDRAGAADAGRHAHAPAGLDDRKPAGKPAMVTARRSIQDPAAGAD